MTYNRDEDPANWRMQIKSMQGRLDLLQEERDHAVNKQREWQQKYFDLKKRALYLEELLRVEREKKL